MKPLFFIILVRDIKLVGRNPGESAATTVIFFVIVATMFSFAANTDLAILRVIGPTVVWVAALLSAMLSLDSIFKADYADGTLDQLLTSPDSLSMIVLAKVTAHWIVTGLPLIVVSPILGILMGLDFRLIGILTLTVVLSTPIFSLVGAFGAALVVAQKKTGVLISLLTLPLCVPILIYSASAVAAAATGQPISGHLSLLAAFLVLSLTILPLATAGTVRIAAGG